MADDFEQEVIRRESSGNPWVGWGIRDVRQYGFDETGFPRRPAVMGPAGPSTASGLYGITGTNWRRLAPKLGVTDFSPESQKKIYQALYSEAGESAWRPFWKGAGGKTSTYDPESGREVPYVSVTPLPRDDPLDLILMAAQQGGHAPGQTAQDDDALNLIHSFIEPPGGPQTRGTPSEAMTGGEPVPAPVAPPTRSRGGPVGDLSTPRMPAQMETIEPPARGQVIPPAPPGLPALIPRQPAPAQTAIQQPAASPLDAILRYAETSLHAMKPALTEIPKAAGEIGQAVLGVGERTGIAEAQMEPGTAPEPQIPIQPGLERIGDVATFVTGGLMSPLGVEARGAAAGGRMARQATATPLDHILDTAKQVVASEEGAISLPPAIQQGITDAAKGIEKAFSPSSVDTESRYGEAIFRRETGRARRSTAQAEAQISRRGSRANPPVNPAQALASEPWRPLVNRHIPGLTRYIRDKQAGLNPPKPPLLRFLDFVETRGTGAAYQGPPELRDFADILRKIYRQRRMAIAAEPSTSWAGFIDDYFAHQWKDPNAARQAFAGGTARQGSGRNLRQRSIPTISEGIDRGLVLATLDPIEATMTYVANMDRYLAHNRIFRIGRADGMIKFHAPGQQPAGWEQLTGRLAERAVATGGQPGALGLTAYAPEGFARIYNNAVSTGFMAGQLGGRFYTALLHAKNAITQSVLALSGYHAFAMMQEANASAFATGIQGLKDGDIKEALHQLGLGSMLIGKALKSSFETGRKLEQQYLGIEDHGPDFARAANLYAGAGGRITRGAEYRSTSASNYFQAFRRGAMALEWKAGLNKITEGNPIFAPARAAAFLGRELGRINETITSPIFDKMIPRLKAAAFFDEMHGWLAANPAAPYEQQLARARMISDTIDDRFGEMVMDNIFWGQRAKQTLQLTATSLGWELGSWRSLGGAVADIARGGVLETKGRGTPADPYRVVREKMSPRVRYLIGLGSAIALENAAYQYLKTGKTPGEGIGGALSPGGAVDMMMPRTGGQTPEGNYERALLPGFEKDILGYFHDPLGEFAGKLAPGARLGVEALTGRDYFGHEIAPFPKYTPQWFRAYSDHVLKSMRPIPLAQDRLKGSNIGMAERFMGNRPAAERWQNPERANRQELMRDIGALRGQLRGLWSHGARTTEERKGLVEKQKEIVRQIDELARQLGARPAPSRIYRPGASP